MTMFAKKRTMKQRLASAALLAPVLAQSQPVQQVADEQWHAHDAWGFIGLGLLMGAAMWFNKRR
jgi:hypothetical protein